MKKFCFMLIPFMLTGCPVAMAYDVEESFACVVDSCEQEKCTIETPEGFIVVSKKNNYYEGKKLKIQECPVELVEPT